MANLNECNQQILGLLSLVGGTADSLFNKTFGVTKSKATQAEFKRHSDSARVNIRKYGVEKPSLTYVGFTAPAIFIDMMPNAVDIMNQVVAMRAERVNQPGVQLATSNVRRYGVGPLEKKPFSASFGDVSIGFLGDSQGVVHQFFYAWLNGIVNFRDIPTGAGVADNFGKTPFEVEYRDNYKTIIDIITYDETQQKIGVIKLYNAYPTGVSDIQRDWAGINDVVRVNVIFTYSHWTYEGDILGLKEPTRETLASKNVTLLGSLMRGMTAIQAISSIKRPQNVNDILNVVNTSSTLLQTFLPAKRLDY